MCTGRYRGLWLSGCLLLLGACPAPLRAYSALTHEAIVDSAWEDSIEPLLRKRFPGATDEELRQAHAYAYGGCIIQDMGYYPHGSELFTNLLHYVRSGDFAAALLEEALPIDEYAFALGALEHYVADQTGHAQATNLAVPIEFPELRPKYDSYVTYENDPTAHLQIEFEFDILQVARGRYTPDAHHAFIGFAVAKDLLDRTFYRVYGIEVSKLIADEDLAIGTYRHTVSTTIPEATKIAWQLKKDEIEQAIPGIQRSEFVYAMSRQRYEKEWGKRYQRASLFAAELDDQSEKPGWFDKMLAFFFRLLPKVGWLRLLAVKPLTPQSELLFATSFSASVDRYREVLQQLPHPLALTNTNLDTGQPTRAGTYKLADKTYAQLVRQLRDHSYADVTPELRSNILEFYGDSSAPLASMKDGEEWADLRAALAELRASSSAALLSHQSPAAPAAVDLPPTRREQRVP